MARVIRRVARFVPRARCLHRALALALWLRRRGVPAEVRIGVRRAPPQRRRPAGEGIEGHAWVEWRGIPLDEDPEVCDAFGRFERSRPPQAMPGEDVVES